MTAYRAKPASKTINWGEPISNGLIWCTYPGLHGQKELVAGGTGALMSAGNWLGKTAFGYGLGSTDTTNGGAYWPYPQKLSTITRSMSLVIWADITSWGAYSALLSVPYASGSWAPPYMTLILQRDNTGSDAKFTVTSGGSNTNCLSSTGYLATTNGMTCYAVTQNASATTFYKNGLSFSSTTGSAGNLDLGSKLPVCLLQHSNSSAGESTGGTCAFAGIWNRVLTAAEVRRLYADPWLLTRQRKGYVPGAGGGGGAAFVGAIGGGVGNGSYVIGA